MCNGYRWSITNNNFVCTSVRFHIVKLRHIWGHVCRSSYISIPVSSVIANCAICKCFSNICIMFCVLIFIVHGIMPFFMAYLTSRRTFILLFAMISSFELASLIFLLIIIRLCISVERGGISNISRGICIIINGLEEKIKAFSPRQHRWNSKLEFKRVEQ